MLGEKIESKSTGSDSETEESAESENTDFLGGIALPDRNKMRR